MKARRQVNVHEAKTNLSRLLEEVSNGADIVIARAGEPVARLVPIKRPPVRKPGLLKGRIRIAADFDAPLPDDLLRTFEGRK
ncbi:MAG TPA: type II toxin-antitoxin system prevent-host-death family antitoxin [Casimicrobiaceae bacterium]|nr:type II toxin-antitoxin system prevent-host-death family antitoxin [Casimicrobiaceae bacterium]